MTPTTGEISHQKKPTQTVSECPSNCFFRGSLVNGTLHCCNYFLMTNKRRPCPAGAGCTVYVGRRVNRRRKNVNR